jgi:hypothetical protein
VQVVLKDRIRFAVPGDDGAPVELEIRVRQDRFGGWEATALLHPQDAPATIGLSRVFRSRDRRLAVGKMVAWVRRRYGRAQPLAARAGGAWRECGDDR